MNARSSSYRRPPSELSMASAAHLAPSDGAENLLSFEPFSSLWENLIHKKRSEFSYLFT